MIVTPNTRTIVEYTLTLSEADVASLRADPYGWAEQLVAQLPPAPGENGHKPKPHQSITLGRKKTARKAAAPKVKKGWRGTAQPGVACPECGQRLKTEGFLARHLKQKHGIQPERAGGAKPPATESGDWQPASGTAQGASS